MGTILIAVAILAGLWFALRPRYDRRGFDRKGIHRNGTRYDDAGYDVRGFDRDGRDPQGYDRSGYDRSGFDRAGYDRRGKNALGQYDRLHDTFSSEDGFLDPRRHPIAVTTHARQRIAERLPERVSGNADALAQEAYRHGRSKRQIKKSSAALIEEIEARHENSVVLIHRGYIYIFSQENTLITVYKNDRIAL